METVSAAPPRSLDVRASLRQCFFAIAGGIMLLVTLWGFRAYYLRGLGAGDVEIAPTMVRLAAVHGGALTAWIVLFLAQTVLVASNRRYWHRVLGWGALAVAFAVCMSGLLVAVRSVQAAPGFVFWGMDYRQFLLIMLVEIATFACFVVLAVLHRKRPQRHRAMMLMATLSILAGATVRMPGLAEYFGDSGWSGIFGPVALLGFVFLALRSLIDGRLDRWMAGGLVGMTAVYVLAVSAATSSAWGSIAASLFGV